MWSENPSDSTVFAVRNDALVVTSRGSLVGPDRDTFRCMNQRHIAPIDRQQQPYYSSSPYGMQSPYMRAQDRTVVEGGFVTQHPWMTFFIVLAGISTVGAILGANRYH